MLAQKAEDIPELAVIDKKSKEFRSLTTTTMEFPPMTCRSQDHNVAVCRQVDGELDWQCEFTFCGGEPTSDDWVEYMKGLLSELRVYQLCSVTRDIKYLSD